MKKIILLSLLAVVGLLGASQILAANATLSVSPAFANEAVGVPFNVSVKIDPAGNKACVIKGTLNFSNLSCKSITLASGLMAQASPTCASPSFNVGIPKCATSLQNIFSVSVKGIKAGNASLSLTGAKVIGEGVDVPSGVQNGAYKIAASKVIASSTVKQNPPASEEQTENQNPQAAQQAVENSPADNGVAGLSSNSSGWFDYVWALLAILIIFFAIYFLVRSRSRNIE